MIDGALLVRPAANAPASGLVYYGKWRDSRRVQVKRRLGPAWVEEHAGGWRKRRGTCPRGYLLPNEAVARLREAIEEHEEKLARTARRPGGVDGLTFGDLADDWLRHGATLGDWKPATARNYTSIVSTHLEPAFGSIKADALDEIAVRRWWRSLHDPRREGGPMSNRNANAMIAALRSLLNWAVSEKLIDANPAGGIRKHREPAPDKAPFFSVEEVWALVRSAETLHRAAAEDPERRERSAASRHDATLFLTAAFTGLRRGELVSLRWRSIDFERRSIYVVDNVSAGIEARVKDGDGRTVPMSTDVAEALARHRPDDARDDDLVFPSRLGRRLDPDALTTRFRIARDAAGLPPLRFHDLRHTFGSLAVDGGASVVQVKDWMGHADVKTTMRYLHTKSRRQDSELLDGAFTGGAGAAVT